MCRPDLTCLARLSLDLFYSAPSVYLPPSHNAPAFFCLFPAAPSSPSCVRMPFYLPLYVSYTYFLYVPAPFLISIICLIYVCTMCPVGWTNQSSSSRTSKGLEQARSELEEERRARQRGSEELSKVQGEVGELRSEETRVKVRYRMPGTLY